MRAFASAACALFALATEPARANDASAHVPGRVVLAAGSSPFDVEVARELQGGDVRIVLSLSDERAPDADPFRADTRPATHFALPAPDSTRESEIAAQIERAACIDLVGGTWIGWRAVLLESRKDTRIARALRFAHERGATIAGQGGAALYLAQRTLVSRVDAQRPTQDPHETSPVIVAEGLGLFEGPLVDIQRTNAAPNAGHASPDLLFERAIDGQIADVLFLAGSIAWVHDPATRTARIVGGGTALYVDIAAGTQSRRTLRDTRLALLSNGALWDERRRAPLGSTQRFDGPARRVASWTGAQGDPPLLDAALVKSLLSDGPSATSAPDVRSGLPRVLGEESWIIAVQVGIDARSLRLAPAGGASGLALGLEVRSP